MTVWIIIGNHWVVINIKRDNWIPRQFWSKLSKRVYEVINRLNLSYVCNSTQYQDLFSVLCGYYCLYYMDDHNMGTTYWNVVKVFSYTDWAFYEKFINSNLYKHILIERYLQTVIDLFLMFWANIRGLGMLSSGEVYADSISLNYILLSVNCNFGLGKWAKIERNDGKKLCIQISLVDWSIYTWARSVSKTTGQNRMGFSYLLEVSRYDCLPLVFP